MIQATYGPLERVGRSYFSCDEQVACCKGLHRLFRFPKAKRIWLTISDAPLPHGQSQLFRVSIVDTLLLWTNSPKPAVPAGMMYQGLEDFILDNFTVPEDWVIRLWLSLEYEAWCLR